MKSEELNGLLCALSIACFFIACALMDGKLLVIFILLWLSKGFSHLTGKQ